MQMKINIKNAVSTLFATMIFLRSSAVEGMTAQGT